MTCNVCGRELKPDTATLCVDCYTWALSIPVWLAERKRKRSDARRCKVCGKPDYSPICPDCHVWALGVAEWNNDRKWERKAAA